MGRFAYYAPLIIGTLVALTMQEWIARYQPTLVAAARWTFVIGVALGVGVVCQVIAVGAQGAFAQVLPVPGGRSIRGRSAVLAGYLIIAGAVGLTVGGMLYLEEMRQTGVVVALVGGGLLAVALLTYGWAWPTAVADFRDTRE